MREKRLEAIVRTAATVRIAVDDELELRVDPDGQARLYLESGVVAGQLQLLRGEPLSLLSEVGCFECRVCDQERSAPDVAGMVNCRLGLLVSVDEPGPTPGPRQRPSALAD